MDFTEHLALSVPVSAGIYLATGDPLAACAYSATAVLIDADHLVDYWRETGLNRDLGRFMAYFNGRGTVHLLLFMHGWEWPAALAAAAAAAAAPLWVLAAAGGWLVHLVQDQRHNGLKPFTYFFAYRWRNRFEAQRFFSDLKP